MFASETGRISTWKTRLLEFSQVGASATSTRGEASAWQSYRDLESCWRRHRTCCDKGVLSSNTFEHRKRPTRSRAKRVPKFKLSLTKKKGHFLVAPKTSAKSITQVVQIAIHRLRSAWRHSGVTSLSQHLHFSCHCFLSRRLAAPQCTPENTSF